MYKKSLLIAFISLPLLWGCGEAGLETDISKINEIEFKIEDLTLGEDRPGGGYITGGYNETRTVNLAGEEFSDYLNDIESFKVNKVEIQLTEVTGLANIGQIRTGLDIVVDDNNLFYLDYSFVSLGQFGVWYNTQGDLLTTDKILLYDDATGERNPATSQSAIDALINALENRSELEIRFITEGRFENANITMKIFLDLTGRAQLN